MEDQSIQEKAVEHLIYYLERFITDTTLRVKKASIKLRNHGTQQRKFKYRVIGPLLQAASRVIDTFKQISGSIEKREAREDDFITNFSDKLFELNELIDQTTDELNVDMTIALSRRDQVYFPSSTNQEAYIGEINTERGDDLRNGQGCWTSEKELYKGNWINGKRNGYGIQIFSDGGYFKGFWREDRTMRGRWIFPKRQLFYGWIHKPTVECPFEYKIGLFKTDQKDLKDIKNCLYYKDRKTSLTNLAYYQELNIQALKGKLNITEKVNLLKGGTYKGFFRDFLPSKFGTLKIQKNPFNLSIPLIEICSKMLAYKRCEPKTYEEIIDRRRIKLEFPNGVFYEGEVTKGLQFIGFGFLGSKTVRSYWLFHPTYGNIIEFLDLQPKIIRFFEKVSRGYFKDSKKYLMQNPQLQNDFPDIDIGNLTVKFRFSQRKYGSGHNLQELEYRGGWSNYSFAEKEIVEVRFWKGEPFKKVIFRDGYCWQNENYDETLKSLLFPSEKVHLLGKLTVNYLDGTTVEGDPTSSQNCPLRCGQVTFKDKSKHVGVFEEDIIYKLPGATKIEKIFSGSVLSEKFRVEYENGLKYEGGLDQGNWRLGQKAVIYEGNGKQEVLVTREIQRRYQIQQSISVDLDTRLIVLNLPYIRQTDESSVDTDIDFDKQLLDFLLTTQRNQEHNFVSILEDYKINCRNEVNFTGSQAVAQNEEDYFSGELLSCDIEMDVQVDPGKFEDPEDFYIYNEDNVHKTMKGTDLKTISMDAIFQEFNYQKALRPTQNIGDSILQEPVVDKDKMKVINEALKQKKQPYLQITKSGCFRSMARLFSLDKEFRKFKQNSLLSFEKVLVAMFELHHLNGISKVHFDRIEFHNGDEYQFHNGERSYLHSLGAYLEFDHYQKKLTKIDNFYWEKFMCTSVIKSIDENYFSEHLRGKICSWDLQTCKKVKVVFKDGNSFYPFWLGSKPVGEGEYCSKDECTPQVSWLGQDAISKNKSLMLSSAFNLALQRERAETRANDKDSYHDITNEKSLVKYSMINSLQSRCESLQELIKVDYDINELSHLYENQFDSLQNFKRDYQLKIDGKKVTFIESLAKSISISKFDEEDNALNRSVKIIYSNGDTYNGKKHLLLGNMEKGVYHWNDGYSYKGEFFLNTPYGKGVYRNCLGDKRKGYFFRGYFIGDHDYGVDDLKYGIQNDILKQHPIVLTKHDLKLLNDPNIVRGSQVVGKYRIFYPFLLEKMQESKKIYSKDLQNIKDGEKDFAYDWTDHAFRQIEYNKRINKYSKMKYVGAELIGLLGGGSERKESLVFSSMIKSDLPNENNLQAPPVTAFNFNLQKDKSPTNKKKVKKNMRKSKTLASRWALGDLNKLTKFEKQQIIEYVKDNEIDKFKIIYKEYSAQDKLVDLLSLSDDKNKNLLMISGELGYRHLFVDLLTILYRLKKRKEITQKKIEVILRQTDDEGNRLVDLISIRGFNVSDKLIFADASWKGGPGDSTDRVREDESSREVMFRNLGPIDGERKQEHFINSLLEMAFGLLSDESRKLFSNKFLNFGYLNKAYKIFSGEINQDQELSEDFSSADIHFMTNSISLDGFKLIRKRDYFETKNCPLHYTFYWADLHSTLALMTFNPMMIFWKNSENEMPPQAIRLAGKRKKQSRAIFASILKEFTRIFNFETIRELLVPEEGFLHYQKKKAKKFKRNSEDSSDSESEELDEEERNDIKSRTYRARKAIDENDDFDLKKVYLFHNNFILLSDELCDQYLNLLKNQNKYRHLVIEYKILKKYTFVEVSELEALQRNFLDFYMKFKGVHPAKSGVNEDQYRENVLKILTWYVYIFGESEIDADIFTLMDISPFEIVFDGKNMIHFMCENNSPMILDKILKEQYKLIEDGWSILPNREDFPPSEIGEYNKKLAEFKRKEPIYIGRQKEFLLNLSKPTLYTQNTAAHLCVMYRNLDCLDILLKYGINLELPNGRGRTIKDLLQNLYPFNLESERIVTIQKISEKLMDYFKTDMLTTCKIHSLAYEFIPNADHEEMKKVINLSKFKLNQELSSVRSLVLERFTRYIQELQNKTEEVNELKDILQLASEFENLTPESRNEAISYLQKQLLKKDKLIQFKEYKLKPDQVFQLVSLFKPESLDIVNQKEFMKSLFDIDNLVNIHNFKFKKSEKYFNKELIYELEHLNFSEPLPSFLKRDYKMNQLFCIEIDLEDEENAQDNLVLDQLQNIKGKYVQYGGGLKIELIKGYPYMRKKWGVLNHKKVNQWFVLITISDQLLKKIAADDQMQAYNMIDEYPTVFAPDNLDENKLEPLRHYQKVDIMMRLIRNEFDIDGYLEKKLVLSYFPIHDYYKRNAIKKLWLQDMFLIHVLDIFKKTQEATLRVVSAISYYHGIQQGFYFGFLCLYTNMLFYLGLAGGVAFFVELYVKLNRGLVMFIGSVSVGLWSSLFINIWKRREKELAFSFDASEEQGKKQIRNKYRANTIIDPATFEITKEDTYNYVKYVFTTGGLFVLAFTMSLTLFTLVTASNYFIMDSDLSDAWKSRLTSVVGGVNAAISFILGLIYENLVTKVVRYENLAYEEDYKNSLILKKVFFKLFTSLFTLIAQSLFLDEVYSFYNSQIISNLVVSMILNYAQSFGVPILLYLWTRYSLSYLLKFECCFRFCKCCSCCCSNGKERLEKFKKDIILEMMTGEKTKHTFMRYCLGDCPLNSDLKKKLESLEETIPKSDLLDLEPLNPNASRTQLNQSQSKEEFERKCQDIEEVRPSPKYRGNTELLGVNRKKNISNRLKEEFTKYVIGREKIIETSYMLDIGSLEQGLHISLLTQYTFIVFFTPFFLLSGVISYCINLGVIMMLILLYVKMSRRSISKRFSTMGVWNGLYDIVGYLGTIYNALLIARFNKSLFEIKNDFFEKTKETTGIDMQKGQGLPKEQPETPQFQIEWMYRIHIGLLLFKFILNLIIPKVLDWIDIKQTRQKLAKRRAEKERVEMISRLGREESDKADGSFDERVFENRDTQSLKHYFRNYNPVKPLSEFNAEKILEKVEMPKMRVEKARRDLN